MRRPSIRGWMGTLALASLVTAVGCQHSKPHGIGMTRSRGTVATAPIHQHGPYATMTPAVVAAQPVAPAAQPVAQPVQTVMLPPVTPQATEAPKEIVKTEQAPAAPVAPPSVETAKGNSD